MEIGDSGKDCGQRAKAGDETAKVFGETGKA
jgi:hypothetical protein